MEGFVCNKNRVLNMLLALINQVLHRLAYWESGDPNNDKVLLCVHGLTRTGRDFDALARAMMGEYRVVCPDMPGRGASDFLKDASAYAVPNYVAAMVTLLARLNARTLDYLRHLHGWLNWFRFSGIGRRD